MNCDGKGIFSITLVNIYFNKIKTAEQGSQSYSLSQLFGTNENIIIVGSIFRNYYFEGIVRNSTCLSQKMTSYRIYHLTFYAILRILYNRIIVTLSLSLSPTIF